MKHLFDAKLNTSIGLADAKTLAFSCAQGIAPSYPGDPDIMQVF